MSHFFNNFREVTNFYNNALQGKRKATGTTLGRFSINPIDRRSQEEFRYFDTGSPFEYELIRMFHAMMREMDVQNKGT